MGRHWQPASWLYSKYKELKRDDLSKYPLLERLDKLDEAGLIHWGKTKTVPRYKYYVADAPGVPYQDIWAYQPGTTGCVYGDAEKGIDQDVKWLSVRDKERLDYPTQKPEGILDRIIRSSCPPNGMVLDPFCGCGTTVAVAQRLGRTWVGIDITHLAISLIKHRLFDAYGIKAKYKVVGEPISLPDAIALAAQDAYQFQWWALGLVGARPVEQKKGADKGIDGRLYFFEMTTKKIDRTHAIYIMDEEKPKQIVFSVKSGKLNVSYVRDLRGVVEREGAAIGVLISLNDPTQPMIDEAIAAGTYDVKEITGEKHYPKIQLLTIADLFNGKTIDCPDYVKQGGRFTATYEKTETHKRKYHPKQSTL
ncbi:MAG: hypothetical protein M1503_04515 [Thaumarchaeota archaeon]|nr:hypothetical protein [Nitrososphaerota archaeon]MCL5317513.1 hypothetical protein [Nitrososphaerota archaeon]